MSAMIGGIDLTLEAAGEAEVPRRILDVVLNCWPDGVFQDANEEATQSVRTMMADNAGPKTNRFFLYRDQASAESWNQEGRTDANATSLLQFVIVGPTSGAATQVTMVCEELTPEMACLYSTLALALARPTAHVNLDAELRAVGCRLTRAALSDLVEDLRQALYPEWTQEELVCHPHEAAQFCDVVRRQADAPLLDCVILKVLLHRHNPKQP